MKLQKIKTIILAGVLSLAFAFSFVVPSFAASQFSVSPMNQKIILTPGETYHGSFIVTNPQDSIIDFSYVLSVSPFYVTENYDIEYKNNGDFNKIVDWIKIDNMSGTIPINSSKEIEFEIDVPLDAPAGGQYATIVVSSNNDDSKEGTVNIKEKFNIAHIIYAEIAGTTERKGEVSSINVPGFIFSGNISGTSSIKNTGNVHGVGTYTLQVFPLFSDEEVYTNEEEPETHNILPDRTLTSTSYWHNTPIVGLFNVIYTAEFEGVTSQVKKMVIVCPIWLLAIIIFAIILLIFWIIRNIKKRNK